MQYLENEIKKLIIGEIGRLAQEKDNLASEKFETAQRLSQEGKRVEAREVAEDGNEILLLSEETMEKIPEVQEFFDSLHEITAELNIAPELVLQALQNVIAELEKAGVKMETKKTGTAPSEPVSPTLSALPLVSPLTEKKHGKRSYDELTRKEKLERLGVTPSQYESLRMKLRLVGETSLLQLSLRETAKILYPEDATNDKEASKLASQSKANLEGTTAKLGRVFQYIAEVTGRHVTLPLSQEEIDLFEQHELTRDLLISLNKIPAYQGKTWDELNEYTETDDINAEIFIGQTQEGGGRLAEKITIFPEEEHFLIGQVLKMETSLNATDRERLQDIQSSIKVKGGNSNVLQESTWEKLSAYLQLPKEDQLSILRELSEGMILVLAIIKRWGIDNEDALMKFLVE